MSYIVEKDWITEAGLRAVVIMTMNNFEGKQYKRHRCGYVGVDTSSKLFGREYMSKKVRDTSVHGGLTYAGGNDSYPVESSLWWFGYDCAHLGDLTPIEPIPHLNDYYFGIDGYERSLEYCIHECESLATQLKDINESDS
jgi:hypothetical protein